MVSQSLPESATGAENTIHDVLLSPSKDPAPALTTRGAASTGSTTGGGTT